MSLAKNAGFAMLDVLIALLLLAVTLTGACATLVQTMRATHGALLATRAIDLAADLTEELHGAASSTQADAVLAAWRVRAASAIPAAAVDAEEFASLTPAVELAEPVPGRYQLTLRWRDTRSDDVRQLSLPVTTAIEDWTP